MAAGSPPLVAFADVLGPPAAEGSPTPPYAYTYVKFLSRGAYGHTYVVQRTADGANLVVKVLSLKPITAAAEAASEPGPSPANGDNPDGAPRRRGVETTSLERVGIEMSNLARVSAHVFCTRLLDHRLVDGHALLFLEYCAAGDLAQIAHVRKRQQRPFEADEVKVILVQLLFALNHLHRVGMIHRDVKAGNAMLCPNGLVKLGDFGMSATVQVAQTFCGTFTHLAPEVWQRQTYGQGADVWSLGVLVYRLLFQELPFSGQSAEELRRKICSDEYVRPSERNDRFEPALIDVVERMLTPDPQLRPSVLDLLRLPAVTNWVNDFTRIAAETLPPAEFADVAACLVRDEVLAVDPEAGYLTVHPVLTAMQMPSFVAAPSPSGFSSVGSASTHGASHPPSEAFVVDADAAAMSAERESQREEARDAAARQEDAAAEHSAPLSGLLAAAPALPAQALAPIPAPVAPPSPPRGKRGIVFKRSKGAWAARALVVTDTSLDLYPVAPAVADALVHEAIDAVADGDVTFDNQQPQVLPLSAVAEASAGGPPLVVSHAELGVSPTPVDPHDGDASDEEDYDDDPDTAETIHPLWVTPRAGAGGPRHPIELGVTDRALRDEWVAAIADAIRRSLGHAA